MSFQQPKTFFKKLKETCGRLDQDVNEIKKKVHDLPGNEEVASKKVCEYQEQIKLLKKVAGELKLNLQPKLEHTANFINHFNELYVETEASVTRQENYLQQYGYKPLEEAAVVASEPVGNTESSPVKEIKEFKKNGCTTPNLIDYGIISRDDLRPTSKSNDRKSSLDDLILSTKVEIPLESKAETSNATPTLDMADLNLNNASETPPEPAYFYSATSDFPKTPTLEL